MDTGRRAKQNELRDSLDAQMMMKRAVQSLDKASSDLLEQQVMMDNVGSTSPVRPAPPPPSQPSPPLFMSALSKLHGGASLQVHTLRLCFTPNNRI